MPSTDARQEQLEKEINEMEQALLSNPEETVVGKDPEAQEPQPNATEEAATKTATETEQVSEPAHPEATATDDSDKEAAEATKAHKRNDWKKRYSTFKASADSTIHQQRQEIVSLTEANIDLSKKLDEATEQVASLSNKDVKVSELVSEEQREIIGDETLDAIQKLQQASVDSKVAPLEAQLKEEKERRLDAAKSKLKDDKESLRVQFISKLAVLVPDYAKIDSDPQFLNWMDEADGDSGLTRRYIFKQAQGLGDVGRVAGFMKEFRGTITTTTPNQTSKELEGMITPQKSASSSTTSTSPDNSVMIWTQESIDRFYNDRIRGTFKGTDKEALALEKDIDLALMEGRIR